MVYVHEPIYASTVSTSDTIHTCSKNIWPCSSNSISHPSWDAKSWCGWSWKWWRVFKTKDTVFLWSRGPTHVEPHPHPLEAVNFLLSLAWQAACGMWAEPEPCYWTEHDLVLVWLGFFFFWLYYPVLGKIRPNKESKAESEGSIQCEWYLHALMHITCFGNTMCFCVLNLPCLAVQSLNTF